MAHHRLGGAEDRLLAADHDGEAAIDGAGLAARHRRVEKAQPIPCRLALQLARELGRGGGVIDQNGARLHAGEGAARAGRDRARVVVIADAHEDDRGLRGGLGGRRAVLAAMLLGPGLGLRRRAVKDGDVVAGLGEMPRHRITHHAQSEKREFHPLPRCASVRVAP